MTSRYGIAEWYGQAFIHMSSERRQALANTALGKKGSPPICPFQKGNTLCNKKGGVCSLQLYRIKIDKNNARITEVAGAPVITCPKRFDQNNLIPRWLAKIVKFDVTKSFLAHEVPFMKSPSTDKAAGRIDLVLAKQSDNSFDWFGLETQAVYFSGKGMQTDFEYLAEDTGQLPPAPSAVRRPDWRSSSAKRLMPQLQVKAPTLRRWGTKLAVAVDSQFFEAVGGKSTKPSQDLDDGDIIWLIPEISTNYQLKAKHWEVLSLEASSEKLLAAETIKRIEFERLLKAKLNPL